MKQKELYSTREAAQYLGISFHTMKYYIHYAKTLKGQKVGSSLVFTKDQLDQFQATKRPVGRPSMQRER